MNFLRRETQRVAGRLDQFLSHEASRTLREGRLLKDDLRPENLYGPIRQSALDFFRARKITWHGNGQCVASIFSSQVAALNFLFPLVKRPEELVAILQGFFPDVVEALPLDADRFEPDGSPYVTFEWMGLRNHLGEPQWGQRGKNATSVDALFRLKLRDGRMLLLLVEWKYTESYKSAKVERVSRNGTDRMKLYGPLISASDSPVQVGFPADQMLVNPFYQLLRLQLLAREMEKAGEMGASCAAVLLIAPRANSELNSTITCRPLATEAATIQEAWGKVAGSERFHAIYTEDLLARIASTTTDVDWADYLTARYGGMN